MASAQDLVLLPGLVCDAEIWAHQSQHLGKIARIIHGPLTAGESMAEMAQSVLDEAPERFALVGFSMGGYVALEMLHLAPERIERLCLVSSNARADTPEQAQNRKRAIEACAGGKYSKIIENMLPVLLDAANQQSPHADFVRVMTERLGADAFARRHKAISTRVNRLDALAAYSGPVRIIASAGDTMIVPGEQEEMARANPSARYSLIEDCGHMNLIEQPQAATALMRDWLLYD